jgi:hypothetical protein
MRFLGEDSDWDYFGYFWGLGSFYRALVPANA